MWIKAIYFGASPNIVGEQLLNVFFITFFGTALSHYLLFLNKSFTVKAVTWSKGSQSEGTSVCYFIGSALQNLLEPTTA